MFPESPDEGSPCGCRAALSLRDMYAGCNGASGRRRVRGQLDSPSPQCITIQGRDAAKRTTLHVMWVIFVDISTTLEGSVLRDDGSLRCLFSIRSWFDLPAPLVSRWCGWE